MFVVYARCFASHVLASKFISTRVDTLGVLDLCNNSGPDLYHFCKHVSHFAHLITTLFVVYARCHATFQVRSGTQHDMQKCILDAKSISEMLCTCTLCVYICVYIWHSMLCRWSTCTWSTCTLCTCIWSTCTLCIHLCIYLSWHIELALCCVHSLVGCIHFVYTLL